MSRIRYGIGSLEEEIRKVGKLVRDGCDFKTQVGAVSLTEATKDSIVQQVKAIVDLSNDFFAIIGKLEKEFGKKNVSFSNIQFPMVRIGGFPPNKAVYITNKKYMSGEDAVAGPKNQFHIGVQ